MLDETIEELTKLYIEEHFKKENKNKYAISKEELIQFCIKLVKVVKRVNDEK